MFTILTHPEHTYPNTPLGLTPKQANTAQAHYATCRAGQQTE